LRISEADEYQQARVFSDVNRNGIQDEGEPGIAGVSMSVVNDNTRASIAEVAPQVSGADGLALFSNVPKAVKLRLAIDQLPLGSRATHRNKGGDDSGDSDLIAGHLLTDRFYQTGDVYTDVDIGLMLPITVAPIVFEDKNSNGIFDDDEKGISGVVLALEQYNASEWSRVPDYGGTSHLDVTTDENGVASFTKVMQMTKCRVRVVDPPPGAMVTHRNKGGDDTRDSDVNSNGWTDSFYVNPSEDGTEMTTVGIGYRMPGTVKVRVWDDSDSDGVQDAGELGIAGVDLQLVYDSNKEPVPDQLATSDESGVATFVNVPQGIKLKVKVESAPAGAIATHRNKGGDDAIDSDLSGDGHTDSFILSNGGGAYTKLDLGFRMPSSVVS